MNNRGYFEIGILHPKTVENTGTLWRTAYQMGAAGIFVIGQRFKRQASDTLQVWRHLPCRQYDTLEQFLESRPYDCALVGVEMGGTMLQDVTAHPMRAQYLLGAEDHGLTPDAIKACQSVISLPAMRTASYNVATAGALVMYHRQFVAGVEKSAQLKVMAERLSGHKANITIGDMA